MSGRVTARSRGTSTHQHVVRVVQFQSGKILSCVSSATRLVKSRKVDLAPSMQRDGHRFISRRNAQLSHVSSLTPSHRSPVLLDVERPLELQVSLVVVVDELGDSLVVAATEQTGGRSLGLDCALLAWTPSDSIAMTPYTSSRTKACPPC